MSHGQRFSRSIFSRKRLTTTDSARSEDSPTLKDQKWQRKMHSNKKAVLLSCQYCTFCPVCKGNNFVCCRYNSPTKGHFSYPWYICVLFTIYILLDMTHYNSITYFLCKCQGQLSCKAASQGTSVADHYLHSQQMGNTFPYYSHISIFSLFNYVFIIFDILLTISFISINNCCLQICSSLTTGMTLVFFFITFLHSAYWGSTSYGVLL